MRRVVVEIGQVEIAARQRLILLTDDGGYREVWSIGLTGLEEGGQ
jgi:hypothetical protein